MRGVALIMSGRGGNGIVCCHGDDPVQWTCVMSRCATNGERQMLLLCGLEGCGWRRSDLVRYQVKPPPPFFFLGLCQREGVGGGRVT